MDWLESAIATRRAMVTAGSEQEVAAALSRDGALPFGWAPSSLRSSLGFMRSNGVSARQIAMIVGATAAKLRPVPPLDVGVTRIAAECLNRRYPKVLSGQHRLRGDGGLAGDFQYQRLWEIALLVNRFSPLSVLELGSGGSSIMFAELLGDAARFTTVEQSSEWRDRLAAAMTPWPRACTSLLAKAIVHPSDRSSPALSYDIDHSQYYDFVYVDGPSGHGLATELQESGHSLPEHMVRNGELNVGSIDIELMWRNNVLPRVVVIDNRVKTVVRLLNAGAHNYDFYLRRNFYTLVDGHWPDFFLYHTVLVRRESTEERA